MQFDKKGASEFTTEQAKRRARLQSAVVVQREQDREREQQAAYAILLDMHQSVIQKGLKALSTIKQGLETREHEAESPLVRVTWDDQFKMARVATELARVLDLLNGER